jgi:pentapeptide MXKDX repeat protein
VTSKGRNRGLGKGPVPVSGEFKTMSKNRIALIITASALVFGVAAAPMAIAAESTDSTDHMMKPHTGMMKGDAMKGHAMKGDAMKGDAMKGHAMKGDAMKGDATKSEPPAQ